MDLSRGVVATPAPLASGPSRGWRESTVDPDDRLRTLFRAKPKRLLVRGNSRVALVASPGLDAAQRGQRLFMRVRQGV